MAKVALHTLSIDTSNQRDCVQLDTRDGRWDFQGRHYALRLCDWHYLSTHGLRTNTSGFDVPARRAQALLRRSKLLFSGCWAYGWLRGGKKAGLLAGMDGDVELEAGKAGEMNGAYRES